MDKSSLRIVYMGTPEFAVAPLKALVDGGYNIVGVVTVPDKPAGRGQHLQQSAVKEYAVQQRLPLTQPERLRDEAFLAQLCEWNADVCVVVAFRMLPEEVFTLPRFGTFNLHASLLPQYRGAAPINRAIMNGETETGVTTFFLDKQMDTGNIIFQKNTTIGVNENVGSLYERLMKVGSALVVQTIDAIADGTAQATPQLAIPKAQLHDAPKITKETRRIDWLQAPAVIHNQVRGLSPYPAATAELHNTTNSLVTPLKILETRPEQSIHLLPAGSIIIEGKDMLKVACRNGFIRILQLQPAGKQAMTAAAFIAGFRDPEHYHMG